MPVHARSYRSYPMRVADSKGCLQSQLRWALRSLRMMCMQQT